MTMEVYKRREISYKKRLDFFSKIMAKAMEKLQELWAAQRVQLCCMQKVLQIKNCQNLPRAGRPKKFKKPTQERSFMKALRCNRFWHLQSIVLACKKSLNFETLVKQWCIFS